MNNESMANFICELRKAKNLTQKQLAEQLNITDKAVSKWERGMGYPDITTLTKLAEVLGVTTNELLNGKREEHSAPKAETETSVQNALKYAEKVTKTNNKNIQSIIKYILDFSFIVSIIVCVICDLAITKSLTWSWYPLTSIVFAWLVIMPLLVFKTHKIEKCMISLSIFIIPFLFCIEQISNTAGWLLPVGAPISLASIAYIWLVYILAKKMENKWYVIALAFAFIIPLSLIINAISAKYVNEPFFDVWDAMSIGIDVLIVFVLFTIGRALNKRQPTVNNH